MDTSTLVGQQVDDGRKLINLLISKNIDVTAACWAKTSEEGLWSLYIATEEVEKKGLAVAYREVYGELRSIQEAQVSTSEIKLIGKSHPITRDILAIREIRTATIPYRHHGPLLGGVGVEELYVYSEHMPLRKAFRIDYIRRGSTDDWRAATEDGELYRGLEYKGVATYSSARRDGEDKGDENRAMISVLLEIAPQFDDQKILAHPDVRRMMRKQARAMADEMFLSRHPGATIEDEIDDENRQEPRTRIA